MKYVIVLAYANGSWITVGPFDSEADALAVHQSATLPLTFLGIAPVVPAVSEVPPEESE